MTSKAHAVRFVEQTGSLEAFLSELFPELERRGIEYALGRDYGPFPASLESRDLDLFVRYGQLEQAYQVVKLAAEKNSSTVLRITQETGMWLLVVCSNLSWALRVDIATPDSHDWRGVCYLDLDRAFDRKVKENGIYRLCANDILLLQTCRDITGRFELRAKYRSAIRSVCVHDRSTFERELAEVFGRRCAASLLRVCSSGNFEDLGVFGKQMRRAVLVRNLMRKPVETTGKILRYAAWRCREYVRPNGVMIAVIGPDGSGKGTLIDKVNSWINGPLHFSTRVYHLRPKLLPSLGSLLLGREDGDAPVTNPHGKQPRGLTASLLRLFYYTVDYVLGYWLSIRPQLARKRIAVVFDRYFYDWVIDPVRFRISVPQWLVRAMTIFVHRPDVLIFLSARPEVIYDRKPELSLSEIRRQCSEMHRVAENMKQVVWIDTCKALDDSAGEMIRAVLLALERRLSQ